MVNQENSPRITHLFRPFNLLIIALTMYLLRFGLLKPMLTFVSINTKIEIVSQISEMMFGLLALSVLLIAAGGYILNDIRDIKADKFNNRPNPVDKLISSESAFLWYQITTGLGVFIGFAVGYQLGNYNLGIIQFAAAVSLWFYSYYFKRELVIGNLIVAFVVALVPLTVGIYEVSLIQNEYITKITEFKNFNFNFISFWFIGYAGFVFVFTWVREILKDIEDLEGDRRIGARTLPIKWGVQTANVLVSVLYIGLAYGLIYVKSNFITDPISSIFIFLLVFLIVLNVVLIWLKKSFLFSPSTWNKLMSLIGIIYLVALGYIINNELFFNV
jgi:4-hydroxybenzoate polyprenyltransferase